MHVQALVSVVFSVLQVDIAQEMELCFHVHWEHFQMEVLAYQVALHVQRDFFVISHYS